MSSAMVLLLTMILVITSDKAVSEDDCYRSVKLLLLFAVIFIDDNTSMHNIKLYFICF